MIDTISCRARVSSDCEGENFPRFFYDGQDHCSDGSYRYDGTIICMACYVEIMPYSESGRLLLHEFDEATEAARINKGIHPVS